MPVIVIVVGLGLSAIIIIVAMVSLLKPGKDAKRSSVPYCGYGPRGPFSGWYRDPRSVGERVDKAIEEGRRHAAQQHFSSSREKRTR